MPPKIEIVQGDITKLKVDVIVNAARPSLLGGGGVDGAIHQAAGPKLRTACALFPEKEPGIRCRTGEALTTLGFSLPAQFVIHTVGPVYDETLRIPEREYLPPETDKDELLFRCYMASLSVANRLSNKFGCKTVAFPAISCGVYGCPVEKGVEIALRAFQAKPWNVDKIFLVLFTDLDFLIALNIEASMKGNAHA
jgi:O-acetyl-ADP-ribose deacetylase (regulator of RNase III)